MSFDDLPQVDRYSENEDQSNIYFRLHFSEKNGFLVTKPEKDKGCDFTVELTCNGAATNWRFPVQIKSVEVFKFIQSDGMITYSFELSRLRYMLHSIPPVGLIILYSPNTNVLYFDFAEAIYNRLLENRTGNMAWKSQKYVNIHIPAINIINNTNLKNIHEAILSRHENSKDRSPALYPEVSSTAMVPEGLGAQIPSDNAAEVLKKNGLGMFYKNELPALSSLVDQTPLKLLREDSHLSLLAGITNLSTGSHVEASFWLEKALNNPVISQDDRAHASWSKAWLDLELGKINMKDYGEQLKAQLQQLPTDDKAQQLKYELSIARNEFELLGPHDMSVIFDIPNRCREFSYRISSTDLTAAEVVGLRLQNITNMGVAVIKFNLFVRGSLVAKKKSGKFVNPKLIAEVEIWTADMVSQIESTFAHLKPLARNFVHPITLAQCFESQVSIWLELNLTALKYPIKKLDFSSSAYKKNLIIYTAFAKEATEIFMDHYHYMSAINTALMILELSELSAYSDVKLDIDILAIHNQADWLQQKLEIPTREIQAKELIDHYNKEVSRWK